MVGYAPDVVNARRWHREAPRDAILTQWVFCAVLNAESLPV